ncbi:MAG: NeuD/PglB/VioB family sugar acetyltransferase [Flavobacteriales bacterium]|nr:NeuD/PglB/VioB family sugar acetyltransferase [Flavobacteriales bacterium]
MSQELVIWGGTGNFKVLCELFGDAHSIIGYFDNDPTVNEVYKGVPCLGGQDDLGSWLANRTGERPRFIVSSGHTHGQARLSIHEDLKSRGLRPVTAVHRTAFVANGAEVGEGSMVFAQAAVSVEARIGRCCIINTRASVDHESVLEDGVSVGPGAIITGLVHVERCADIYAGAIILPRLRIGEGAVVGAGAVVRDHVAPYTMVAGNPARVIRNLRA